MSDALSDLYTDPCWDPIHLELGRLIVVAGDLEAWIKVALMNMMPGSTWSRTQLVVDGFSTAQVRERCARLAYEMLEGELQVDVLEWLRQAGEAQARRNAIVHSQWRGGLTNDAGVVWLKPAATRERVTKAKLGLQVTTEEHSPQTIAAVREMCQSAADRGVELSLELQMFADEERRGVRDESEKWRRGEAQWEIVDNC